VFSSSVAKLFTILADIASRATKQPPMFLCFGHAHRPSGFRHSKYIDWAYPKSCSHSRKKILEAKAVSGYFELVCDVIPTLHGVSTFQFKNLRDLEDLRPSWIGEIVGRLPSLEKLLLESQDLYELGRHERIVQRQRRYFRQSFWNEKLTMIDLTTSMCSLDGSQFLEIQLEIKHNRMENEGSPVHLLVKDGHWAQESWFLVLDHLASFQNLTILRLLGGLVVCPEFFRGINCYSGTPFPSLVEFELEFAAETADGKWYHERDNEALKQSRGDPEYDDLWE
jgi:hypothetical protein